MMCRIHRFLIRNGCCGELLRADLRVAQLLLQLFHVQALSDSDFASHVYTDSCPNGKHVPISELLSQKYRLHADIGRWFKVVYAFDEIGFVR